MSDVMFSVLVPTVTKRFRSCFGFALAAPRLAIKEAANTFIKSEK